MLDDLEVFRGELQGLFADVPGDVAVIVHPRPLMMNLAAPWLPLARLVSAPAGRRYFAGFFGAGEIHVLARPALEKRASGVPGSLEALLRTPRHEYAHVVVGANNDTLPPPFSPATFRRYVRSAWLCEGAASYLAGQAPLMRAAVARRLHEGGRPQFPAGVARRARARRHGVRAARPRGGPARMRGAGPRAGYPQPAQADRGGVRPAGGERRARLAGLPGDAHDRLRLVGVEHSQQRGHHALVELACRPRRSAPPWPGHGTLPGR